jgi:hypothetical protein
VLIALAWCGASELWAQGARWPEQKVNAGHAQQPWLVDSYVPKSAIHPPVQADRASSLLLGLSDLLGPSMKSLFWGKGQADKP